jgi:hypothetical protein
MTVVGELASGRHGWAYARPQAKARRYNGHGLSYGVRILQALCRMARGDCAREGERCSPLI